MTRRFLGDNERDRMPEEPDKKSLRRGVREDVDGSEWCPVSLTGLLRGIGLVLKPSGKHVAQGLIHETETPIDAQTWQCRRIV